MCLLIICSEKHFNLALGWLILKINSAFNTFRISIKNPGYSKFLEKYEVSLKFCIQHRAVSRGGRGVSQPSVLRVNLRDVRILLPRPWTGFACWEFLNTWLEQVEKCKPFLSTVCPLESHCLVSTSDSISFLLYLLFSMTSLQYHTHFPKSVPAVASCAELLQKSRLQWILFPLKF